MAYKLSKQKESAKEFAIRAHESTNHHYDDELPYSFHLRLVVKVAKDFQELGEILCGVYNRKFEEVDIDFRDLIDACWLHDTIEDARVNYNAILFLYNDDIHAANVNKTVAEIVHAVTNVTRGRTRSERMPQEVYDDIKATPGATFVKMCDRIANVQYSKMMGSGMFKKYAQENEEFLKKIDGYELQHLQPMVDRLKKMFEND